MSSSTPSSKKPRSGTGSSSRSSTKSGSKSGSKSKSSSKTVNPGEWSAWQLDPNSQPPRDYRVRENDGDYEYQYYNHDEESRPRYPGTGGKSSLYSVGEDQPQASSIPRQDDLSALPAGSGAPNYTTDGRTTGYGADPDVSSLGHDLARTRLDPSLSQIGASPYGTQEGSMVNDEDSPTSRDPRPSQGYSSLTPNSNAQFPYRSSSGQPNPDSSYSIQSSPSPWATATQPAVGRAPSVSVESEHYLSAAAQEDIQQELGSPKKSGLKLAYKVHHAREFTYMRIFSTLWTEPKGQGMPGKSGRTDGEEQKTKFGEEYYTSIRRFVIFRPDQGHCLCLPILTYGGQGTKKPGVKPQDHAIIYIEGKNKGQKPTGLPGEVKLLKEPIRMNPRTSRDQLEPSSRLNYAKIYTVEYNVKVHFIGEIHKKSVSAVVRAYNEMHQPLPETDNVEFEGDIQEEQ